ncbi:hypothetical protein CAOG_06556 [Capsaspora owczarzaki ATCC 30864]|uniref:FYVE-type domain-containing protein n=1 Tax=Capsaspora owczarzaki (strain ATCC 30864) TaxID=595528 RepID=A0A0D2WVI0_CAPO3|nr:hypothetical protein CAOG_06556 [Capsaspora owczarzaki ATCC 30864]KJE96198.1 hypothetical protein CAOG_006556 [Capsaspora owczarzaki ATCC 30864]|eukprot:XP_004345305.1 hypothetical protein CAOG_06556 [Capsaspora owczarzaki ATCC 30864]
MFQPLSPSPSALSTSGTPTGSADEAMSKRQRKVKLAKLQAMLGDPLSERDLKSQNLLQSPSLGSSATASDASSVAILSSRFRDSLERLSVLFEDQNAVEALLANVIGFDTDDNDDDDANDDDDDDNDDESDDEGAPPQSRSTRSKSRAKKLEARLARRRKLRKLHHFFGDRPTRDLLFEQHIFRNLEQEITDVFAAGPEGDQLRGVLNKLRERFRTKSQEEQDALNRMQALAPPTINVPVGTMTLTKKQRTAKLSKLTQVLGAPLSLEQLLGQSLFDDGTSPQPEEGVDSEEAIATNPDVLMHSISKLKTIVGDEEAMQDVLSQIVDDQEPPNPKETRQHRMKKLHNFFGDAPARHLLFEQQILQSLEDVIAEEPPAQQAALRSQLSDLRASFSAYKRQSLAKAVATQGAAPVPSTGTAPNPLTKQQRIKKLVKLQQILGAELPASEESSQLMLPKMGDRRESIASVASTTSSSSGSNAVGLHLRRLSRIVDDQDAVEGLLASVLGILDQNEQLNKELRKKRLRKLHHFFGDRPQRDLLFEHLVFEQVELEIETEGPDSERKAHAEELERLRRRFKEQSERDLKQLGYRPHTRTETKVVLATGGVGQSAYQTLSKKQRVRKLTKLQELLGETLPVEEQMNQSIVTPTARPASGAHTIASNREKLKQSVKQISSILQDDPTALHSVLETLQSSGTDTESEDLDADATPQEKELRRKRLRKLQSFFGDRPSENILLEQQVIQRLEARVNAELDAAARAELEADLDVMRRSLTASRTDIPNVALTSGLMSGGTKASSALAINPAEYDPDEATNTAALLAQKDDDDKTNKLLDVAHHSSSERFAKQSMQGYRILGFVSGKEDPAPATTSITKLPSFMTVGDSANRSAIRRIDERFGDSSPLAIEGRVLLHEGALTVIDEKGNRKKREFFLFNDVLVYGKKKLSRLGSKHVMPLDNLGVISVADDVSTDVKNVFHIVLMSAPERLTVCTESVAEKQMWIDQITTAVTHAVISWHGELKDVDAGQIWTPQWMPETDVRLCSLCLQTRFSMLHRKHHCSVCGLVVCSSCSPHLAPVARTTAIGAAILRSRNQKRSSPAANSPDDLSNSSSTLYGSNSNLERSSTLGSQSALSSDDSDNVYVRVCSSCTEKGVSLIANSAKLAEWNCDLAVFERELAKTRNLHAHNPPNAPNNAALLDMVDVLTRKVIHYLSNIARFEYILEIRSRKRLNAGKKAPRAKLLYDTVQLSLRNSNPESDI